MGDNLFEGLPPPAAASGTAESPLDQQQQHIVKRRDAPIPTAVPQPILKSALKRSKPMESAPQAPTPPVKSIRFTTTIDASEAQVIEAMHKIASHIRNPTKLGKASKLAIQLIQAGSVKPGTSHHFFAILEAAMSVDISHSDPNIKADYYALLLAAQDAADCLNRKQKNLLMVWTMSAVVAYDLCTDDSFVFSKAAGRVKEAISALPVATEDDDIEETAALKDDPEATDDDNKKYQNISTVAPAEESNKDEFDPFGLDALIPSTLKKDEKTNLKKEAEASIRKEEENRTFLKLQREALITCLEVAARRYKTPWCQTVIDITIKHAYDNIARFTSRQRDAIEKLWVSIREQQTRRKQGKSVTGKLDMNAFERLQQKYASEKMSIRRSVGGSGDRKATQWLG